MEKGLHQYLIDNPKVTKEDIKKTDHIRALNKFYDNRINKAKKDAGVPEKYIRRTKYSKEEWKEMDEELIEWLKESPDATLEDIKNIGYETVLIKLHHHSINEAKKKAGIPEKYIKPYKYSEEEEERKNGEFIEWLKENPNASQRDACKAGHEYVLVKNYHNRINEAKEKIGLSEEIVHIRRPKGYWTKERVDECYDKLKREIKKKEKKVMVPTRTEFCKKYYGAYLAIKKKNYPDIKTWIEYVKSRGDTPNYNFRNNETKSELLFNYFSSDASLIKIGDKFDIHGSQIFDWTKDPKILELICKKIGIDKSKIFNVDDLLDSGIHEKKVDKFLNKLISNEIAYQIGEDYTTDKRFLDDFNSIFEGLKVIKKRSKRTGVVINGKSHEYTRDMAVEISETKEREVAPVKRNNKVKRIGIIEDKGDYFQLLGMLNRLKEGNSSFDYQKQMQELEASFVESYRNSPEWISQYKLADFLIGD